MAPELRQHPLDRADGSAIFSDGLYSVLAAVNGPIEVQRRDELPEEAAIEINIRPSSGIGGPRERWLETVIQSAVRQILLVHLHPRTLMQITLQVTKEPSLKIPKSIAAISIVPSLVNASFLALVDGGLPLSGTLTAALVAVTEDGTVKSTLDDRDLLSCKSIHAMAFNQHGEQILDESSGQFDVFTWEKVFDAACKSCISATISPSDDTAMGDGVGEQQQWLRDALQGEADRTHAWQQA